MWFLLIPANIKDKDYKFTVGVSLPDCTGCSLCSEICPGKKGAKAIVMKMKDALLADKKDEEYKYLFNEVSEKKDVIHYDFNPEKTTFIDSVPGEFFLFFPSDWHIAKIATDKEDQDIRVIVIKLDYI